MKVYRNGILQSMAKKRAPDTVTPSNSHTGAVAAKKPGRERETRQPQRHNSTHIKVVHSLVSMRVFRLFLTILHFVIHCSCYKLTVDTHYIRRYI